MNRTSLIRSLITAGLGAAMLSTSCTLKNQEAPSLTGPSEFATSLNVSATPDILTQDGASQALVTVLAHDAGGTPLRNVSLRSEIIVNGVRADFGSLSARQLVTDSAGRATLVYTAPAAPAGPAVDTGTLVSIAVTALGSDFANGLVRGETFAIIRLVPVGIVVPPDGLQPRFTFTPTSPTDHQDVLFNASTSSAPANNPIVTYGWNFGDGRTASGQQPTHAYGSAGLYNVTLTISDAYGRSAQTSQPITVNAGLNPTAAFTVSPTAPIPGQQVNLNASSSRAATGHRIVSYGWDCGDGKPGVVSGSPITSCRYLEEGTYTVTLVVTDETGKTGVAAGAVPVKFPEAIKSR